MNLVLDLGNTACKLAVFQADEIADVQIVDRKGVTTVVDELFLEFNIQQVIVGSVIDDALGQFLSSKGAKLCFALNHHTPIPIIHHYKTPETLGMDRLANVIGASGRFPNESVLVVDVGTCIKLDLVNGNGVYEGGTIAPGLKMKFKALNAFTDKLPLIDYSSNAEFIGSSTTISIVSGVVNGTLAEIDGMINRFETLYPNLKVVFTGGDGDLFYDKGFSRKNSIFADRWLTLRGLNKVLNFNAQ